MQDMNSLDTKENIVIVAESLIQRLGYNAFSYKDISDAVGIKKASIHHHFPKKEDLGAAVIDRHLGNLEAGLQAIANQSGDIKSKLNQAYQLILSVTYNDEQKMCLGGMLVSDVHTLPRFMQAKLKLFFDGLINWGDNLIGKQRDGHLIILQFVAMIEGVLLLGRIYGIEDFTKAIDLFVNNIKV